MKGVDFHHKKNHIRYIAHIINLTTIEILKNIKAGEAQEEITILANISKEHDTEVIPRLRKLIVKIRSSPQRRERFSQQIEVYGLKSLNLILDVKTRWNSTYFMLQRTLKLQEVSILKMYIMFYCELVNINICYFM